MNTSVALRQAAVAALSAVLPMSLAALAFANTGVTTLMSLVTWIATGYYLYRQSNGWVAVGVGLRLTAVSLPVAVVVFHLPLLTAEPSGAYETGRQVGAVLAMVVYPLISAPFSVFVYWVGGKVKGRGIETDD